MRPARGKTSPVDRAAADMIDSAGVAGVVARSDRLCRALRSGSPKAWPRPLRRYARSCWIDPAGHVAVSPGRLHIAGDRRPLLIAVAADPRSRPALESIWQRFSLHGLSSLSDVRGAFALAIWDAERQELTLGRDIFGQRQIYFMEDADGLWFSTELSDLLLAGPRHPSLDMLSAISYLTRGMPLVGRTLAAEIRSVPAAHLFRYDRIRSFGRVIRYWTPLRPVLRRTRRGGVVRDLRDAFENAVSACLSDSPTAVLLSGGVDSSLVACVAASRAGTPPCGFTLAFDDEASDDVRYSRLVANAIGARHVIVRLDAHEAAALLDGVLVAPSPASAWTVINHSRLLAELAGEGFGSVLSGMGADELFGGYDRTLDYFYRQRAFFRRWRAPGDWFAALLQHQGARETLFPGMAAFFGDLTLGKYLSSDALPTPLVADIAFYTECQTIAPEASGFAMMMAHEVQARIPDLLMQGFEPFARRNGITFAYPFLDPATTSISACLTPDEQYWFERGAWWAKRTVRRMAHGIVPPPIVMRRRTPYDAPIAHWMRNRRFGSRVIERIAGTRLWGCGLFRRSARTALLREARGLARGDVRDIDTACLHAWIVVTMAAWYDRFVERI